MAAYCEFVGAHMMTYWCILKSALSISGGAHTNPMRQPVMANALEKPEMSTVLSRIPSNEAMDTCLPP